MNNRPIFYFWASGLLEEGLLKLTKADSHRQVADKQKELRGIPTAYMEQWTKANDRKPKSVNSSAGASF